MPVALSRVRHVYCALLEREREQGKMSLCFQIVGDSKA